MNSGWKFTPDWRDLADEIAERFGLTDTRRPGIPAHMTYAFTTPNVAEVDGRDGRTAWSVHRSFEWPG